jgi:hypothetical protein
VDALAEPDPLPPASDAVHRLLFATVGGGTGGAGGGFEFGVGIHHHTGHFGLDLEGSTVSHSGAFTGAVHGGLMLYTRTTSASWYLGGGLGLGGMTNDAMWGSGVSAHAAVGYEFGTTSEHFGSFIQAELAKPLYDIPMQWGPVPAPSTFIVSLGLGVGL